MAHLMKSGSFILEIDVAMSADSVLFLFHDDTLERLTRNTGNVANRPWRELDTMQLRDRNGDLTRFTIPKLDEALHEARGKALLMLDRKHGVSLAMLLEAIEERGMEDQVGLILYDQRDYEEWAQLAQLGPVSYGADNLLALEQLAQRNRELYPRVGYKAFRQRNLVPSFVFLGVGQPRAEMLARANTLGIQTIVGTFGDLDQQGSADDGAVYRQLAAMGIDVIATNRPLAAARALASANKSLSNTPPATAN